jgi:hypothetical protein
MATDFTLVDVLAEVSDDPSLFNALSPESRQILLTWRPGQMSEAESQDLVEPALTEIATNFYRQLSREAQTTLLAWLFHSDL